MSAPRWAKSRRFHRLLAASAISGVTGLCACAEDGGSVDDTSVTDAGGDSAGGPDSGSLAPAHERVDCDLPVVIEYCGGATCHYDNAAAEVASSLVLWDRQAGRMVPDVHERLVGVPATYRNVPDPERCPSEPELLVDPSNIERSLLLRKLMGDQECGVEMPRFPYPEWGTVANPGPEREAFVQCIRAWVTLLVEDFTQM